MDRMLFTDKETAAKINGQVVTDVHNLKDCVEIIINSKNYSILETLVPVLDKINELSISYWCSELHGFERLDSAFFGAPAAALHSFLKLCQQRGIRVIPSKISKLDLSGLFNKRGIVRRYPKRVFVELTRNCNSFCIMCHRRVFQPEYQKYDPRHNMDFGLFRQIADTLFSKAEFVDLRGWGESTILPDFNKYLDYALKFKTKYGLVTNLSLKNDVVLRKLVYHHFLLDISIDGASKTIYEKIRRGLKLEQLIKNVRIVVSASSKSPPTDVAFLFTVQRENVAEAVKIVELAYSLGIGKVKFSAVCPKSEFDEIFKDYSKESVMNILMAAKARGECLGVEVKFLTNFERLAGMEKDTHFSCPAPHEYLYINYNGSLGGCNCQLCPVEVGKFDKNISICWNSPGFLALRNSIGSQHQPEECAWCQAYRVE